MVARKNKSNERVLTDVELELMNIIWQLGECTVKEVQEALPPGRELAYTSVATMMKILEQKKILKVRKSERVHSYLAMVSKSDYEASTLKHIANNLFHGNSTSMVMKLLTESDLSEQELHSIQALIDARLSK